MPLPSSIRDLREQYRAGALQPLEVLEAALQRANSNAGANVYLARDEEWSRREALQLSRENFDRQPLWGVPVALKDCFDLVSFTTTYGAKALAETALGDSAVAARLRAAGAVITGKTHLHQLAYGITGQSHDFGDCLQPRDARLLTGGSSSGSAASVQEGSAMAAIGTDTGGSIRVPVALCGLVGYRGSVTLGRLNGEDIWRGAGHLAATFDTLGWLYRDAADGPLLGAALFDLPIAAAPEIRGLRVGIPDSSFLHDCEPEVLSALEHWIHALGKHGAIIERFDAAIWSDAMEIFAPIQASEAAALHPEPRDVFEPPIAERLRWGAGIPAAELTVLRERMTEFRRRSEQHLEAFNVLLLPNSPVTELRATDDHASARARILRYTSPISLLGWPAVTLPSRSGGPQLVGKLGSDAELLALSAALSASNASLSQ